MTHHQQFYINGAWVDPVAPRLFDVINPATEAAYTQISMGGAADVDRAVARFDGIYRNEEDQVDAREWKRIRENGRRSCPEVVWSVCRPKRKPRKSRADQVTQPSLDRSGR